MKNFLIIVALAVAVAARPEIPPPNARYVPPGPPGFPSHQYGPPAKEVYGPPAPQYGPPPAQQYGPPPSQKLIVTKNVYVHVPPPERVEFVPSRQIEAPVPKKHYKIIFIKAPAPPAPIKQVIPETPQDIHKTLVYVLVKKPEPQPEIEVPEITPTEPSKPEVFFIKYKEPEKKEPQQAYGPPDGPY